MIQPSDSPDASLEAYFLGQIELERCIALQRRLVHEASSRGDARIDVLFCEHPQVITIGRSGSPADVQYVAGPLRSGRILVRWIRRGGGTLVHAPGQLAVYPIVSLKGRGWTVGEYLARFQAGIGQALQAVEIRCQQNARSGLWGRTGQLVAFGVGVSQWVTSHGAFINVSPPMGLFHLVDSDRLSDSRMSTLVAERGRPVKMTRVRAELVRHLADAFGCRRQHFYTGHPWLRRSPSLVH